MRKRLGIGLVIASLLAMPLGTSTVGAADGFDTAKPAYVVPIAPGVQVDAILSTGDIIGDYQMSGIPDGLGAYIAGSATRSDNNNRGRNNRVVVVMNHELGRSFPNNPPGVDTRISRIEIDSRTRRVYDAEYLFDGTEGYERFCSATLAIIDGRPLYFTGEEAIPQLPAQPPGPAHDGSSIVMDPDTGMYVETEHFGHFQHENVLPIKLSKWVFLSSEDDFRVGQPSYLYAYIANDFNRGLRGREGSLYVWQADNAATNQNSAAVKGVPIPGRFVPITQAENADSTTLKAAATAKNGFRFDRLEDIALRPDVRGRVYIADTGKPAVAGDPTPRGRVYQFDIDPRDPTRATLTMILNGDAVPIPGDAASNPDDIYNPDNLDASERVLVIQEDRESAYRNDYNRVLTYNFKTKVLTPVAFVNTTVFTPLTRGNWESSGVIDAGHLLGRDWWLLDVQAHNATAPQPGPTLVANSASGEDGQLLAIYIPNSQGDRHNSNNGENDDDDDDD